MSMCISPPDWFEVIESFHFKDIYPSCPEYYYTQENVIITTVLLVYKNILVFLFARHKGMMILRYALSVVKNVTFTRILLVLAHIVLIQYIVINYYGETMSKFVELSNGQKMPRVGLGMDISANFIF